MALKIHALTFGELTMDASGLVLFRAPGTRVTIPFLGYLITGGQEPVLVDTGASDAVDWAAFGMGFRKTPEMALDAQLARFGLRRGDIGKVVHTHAHLDHVGQDNLFPMSTMVAISRQELEFSVSGVMGPGMYTAADTRHLIDRLHTPGALRLFDVDGTFEEEVIPGVAVRLTGGHTPGSISVLVETDEGLANIAGDIAYNVADQIVTPLLDQAAHEPTITGNRAMRSLEEKRAIKRALSGSRFLLVGHDLPALVEGGRIVARHRGAFEDATADLTRPAEYTGA
ncbi:N-acyl homoserine lactonase family protein [Oceanicella sp. SM1341]|uniref:N-acyl homoserine lactonase family protein n=1 Tax=Oceanicella sp. SM1341 TaxID=1548889 RepID=UPI000E4AA371|nr:N-acyl homoserine lactonase family protein [Oceanicella sp. SM1341]